MRKCLMYLTCLLFSGAVYAGMEETLLTSWFNAFNQRDFGMMEAIYSEDALIHSKEGPVRGGRALAELCEKWIAAIPDAKIEPLLVRTEDDVIVVHWRVEGTFKRGVNQVLPTNDRAVFHGLTCFRCEGDKVIEHWALSDYRSLGMTRK